MDRKRCFRNCPQQQTLIDGQCVCNDGFVRTADGSNCECPYFIGTDGESCVKQCAFAAHPTEQRCVAKCDSWDQSVTDGRCKKLSWLFPTAIAVPAALVVAVAICVTVCVVKRKKRTPVEIAPANRTNVLFE